MAMNEIQYTCLFCNKPNSCISMASKTCECGCLASHWISSKDESMGEISQLILIDNNYQYIKNIHLTHNDNFIRIEWGVSDYKCSIKFYDRNIQIYHALLIDIKPFSLLKPQIEKIINMKAFI